MGTEATGKQDRAYSISDDVKQKVTISRGNRREQEISQVTVAKLSKKTKFAVPEGEDSINDLESKGFGVREDGAYHLKDYEVLYLLYNNKLRLFRDGREMSFVEFVAFAMKRDDNSWTRFLIFRDLRSRGYVVREGFGFPIDFRVYERGDYGQKAAKYIVFGLNEGKTMSVRELRKHVEEMAVMGKESVVAVVERRGEVIYYKVTRWRPIKSVS